MKHVKNDKRMYLQCTRVYLGALIIRSCLVVISVVDASISGVGVVINNDSAEILEI